MEREDSPDRKNLDRKDFVKALAGVTGAATAAALLPGSKAEAQVGSTSPSFADVKAEFGAKGDGKTDDSAAIQRAFDSLPITGGTVYFPVGTYLLGTPITIRNSAALGAIKVQGEGTNTYSEPSSGLFRGSTLKAKVSGMTLLDFDKGDKTIRNVGPTVLDMNFAATGRSGVTGLHIRMFNNWTVERCSFRDLSVGLKVNSDQIQQGGTVDGGDASWGFISQCRFLSCTSGVFVPYSGGFLCQGGNFYFCKRGIDIRGGSQHRVMGIKGDQCSQALVYTEGAGGYFGAIQAELCGAAVLLSGNNRQVEGFARNGHRNMVWGVHMTHSNPGQYTVRITSLSNNAKVGLLNGAGGRLLIDKGTNTVRLPGI